MWKCSNKSRKHCAVQSLVQGKMVPKDLQSTLTELYYSATIFKSGIFKTKSHFLTKISWHFKIILIAVIEQVTIDECAKKPCHAKATCTKAPTSASVRLGGKEMASAVQVRVDMFTFWNLFTSVYIYIFQASLCLGILKIKSKIEYGYRPYSRLNFPRFVWRQWRQRIYSCRYCQEAEALLCIIIGQS